MVHASMNDMKKQEIKNLRDVAQGVGSFIRYWGFRKIHGQIWTLLYLAKRPLSGAELVELLDVSKALVSPGLKQLETEGLIHEVESENGKVKRYAAIEDVGSVFRREIQSRESKMINDTQTAFLRLQQQESDALTAFVNPGRAQSMGQMIETAQFGIDFLLGTKTLWQ